MHLQMNSFRNSPREGLPLSACAASLVSEAVPEFASFWFREEDFRSDCSTLHQQRSSKRKLQGFTSDRSQCSNDTPSPYVKDSAKGFQKATLENDSEERWRETIIVKNVALDLTKKCQVLTAHRLSICGFLSPIFPVQ